MRYDCFIQDCPDQIFLSKSLEETSTLYHELSQRMVETFGVVTQSAPGSAMETRLVILASRSIATLFEKSSSKGE